MLSKRLRYLPRRKNLVAPVEDMQNGRINFTQRSSASGSADALPGFGFRTEVAASEAEDMIRGNMSSNPLNSAFFSPANVQIVQNKLRRDVYDRSHGEFLIDEQSVDELMIVMRSMYLQYGKNQPTDIAGQIVELNQIVADWSVPKILAECSMHKTYLRDIQTLPVPLSHPILLTKTGTKSATFDRFF